MSNDSDMEQLSQLRAHLDRPLADYLHRASFLTPTGGDRRHVTKAGGGTQEGLPMSAVPSINEASGATSVNVNLNGGTIVLDDERSLRALAKEIKRLITEDIRRGIWFGG